jgi:NADH-quinone oxidoreductase subunit H
LTIARIDVGVLFVLGITSVGVYGIALAGWSSNSKYSLMGGLRSSAQMISYELAEVAALGRCATHRHYPSWPRSAPNAPIV